MSNTYLYSVVVDEFPEGAFYDDGERNFDWRPEGADPDEWFSWPPIFGRKFLSRGTARRHVKTIEGYGAKAHIVRSNPVTWPGDDE